MKVKIQLMFIMFMLLFSNQLIYAIDATPLGCNINAGADYPICQNDFNQFDLQGSSEESLTSIVWTLMSGPGEVVIDDSSSLTTTFSITNPVFDIGVYTFQLSGLCAGETTLQMDVVEITVYPGVTEAAITFEDGFVLDEFSQLHVCNDVVLFDNSSSLATGEYFEWSTSDNLEFESFAGGVSATHITSTLCGSYDFTYTISNDGCESSQTITVVFENGTPASILNEPDMFCGTTMDLFGSINGCVGVSNWTITPPAGVSIPNSFTSPDTHLTIDFVTDGQYQIDYTTDYSSFGGVCPNSSDQIIVDVCLDSVPIDPLGENEDYYFCGEFPNVLELTIPQPQSSGMTFSNWSLFGTNPGSPPVDITTDPVTSTGTVIVYDQALNFYNFIITGTYQSDCSEDCPTTTFQKIIRFKRIPEFVENNVVTNLICEDDLIATYNISDYLLTTSHINQNDIEITMTQAPDAFTIPGLFLGSSVEFSEPGIYVIEAVIDEVDSEGIQCTDFMTWTINVSIFQSVSAGSSSETCLADNETVTVAGSNNINSDGEPIDIDPGLWTQVSGDPTGIVVAPIDNTNNANVSGFSTLGVYEFEYSYSSDSDCEFSDTMSITVINCDTISCPDYFIYTCCDLEGGIGSGKSAVNAPIISPIVQEKISAYNREIKLLYPIKSMLVDSCCMFCEFPDVPFPVFVFDEFGMLVNSFENTINWSHDPDNHNATAYIIPNEFTTVTVISSDDCIWTGTFGINCCDLDLEIVSYCPFDPCLETETIYPIGILANGELLDYSGESITWSNGSNANQISITTNDLPLWVSVYDSIAECSDTAFFDINCDTICNIEIPQNLSCINYNSGLILEWDPVPNAFQYEVELFYGDPSCCLENSKPYTVTLITTLPNAFQPKDKCFSWKVRAFCLENNSVTEWSTSNCSCTDSGNTTGDLLVKTMPNPAQNDVLFLISSKKEKKSQVADLYITNLSGMILSKSKIMVNEKTVIDLSEMKNGIYMYKIITNNDSVTGKISVLK